MRPSISLTDWLPACACAHKWQVHLLSFPFLLLFFSSLLSLQPLSTISQQRRCLSTTAVILLQVHPTAPLFRYDISISVYR